MNNFQPEEIRSLQYSVVSDKSLNATDIYEAINPRSPEEVVSGATILMPHILRSEGKITTQLMVFQPSPNDAIWDTVRDIFTGKRVTLTKEKRAKSFIGVRGHTRIHCARLTAANPSDYSATVVANLTKLPCQIIDGDLETMQRLAMDAGEAQTLYGWDVVRHIIDQMGRDVPWREILADETKLVVETLLPGGVARLAKIRTESNGVERVKKTCTAMRNILETHIYGPVRWGPTAASQLILWWRFDKDSRPGTVEEKAKLLCDFKYTNVSKLQQLFLKLEKADEVWVPITKIAIVDKAEKGSNVSSAPVPDEVNRHFIVVGGHPEFRAELLTLMHLTRKPEDAVVDTEEKPPKLSERKDVERSCTSNVALSLAQLLNRNVKEPINGKTRLEWDREAARLEKISEVLANFEAKSPLVQAAIDAIIAGGDRELSGKKAVIAFQAIDKALAPAKVK